MTIYIVINQDGIVDQVFTDHDLAWKWCNFTGGLTVRERTLDDHVDYAKTI